MKRIIRKIVLVLATLYLAGGLALYFLQERLIFHPVPLPAGHLFSVPGHFTEVNVRRPAGNLSYLRFSPAGAPRGIVLFFHGNMKNVEHYGRYPGFFTRSGYEVWMIDYPGFGKTTGKRSEQRMYEDALFFYDQAALEGKPLVIYGKSIGTGVAAFVAAQRPCRQLVLETPYYSLTEMARHFLALYPVRPLLRYRFPTYQYLQSINAPVTLLHGTRDELIPYTQALRLQQLRPGIGLVTIPGGRHNNLADFPLFQQALDSVLAVSH